jgi:hypothetical protein
VKKLAAASGRKKSGDVDSEYLCEWVNVENAIGATTKGAGLVPRKDLPFHPMEQHASHFQLTRMLRAMNHRMPVIRIFLTFYYDEFGAHNRIFRKVGGVYAGFGNLPRFLQDLLANIMTVAPCHPGYLSTSPWKCSSNNFGNCSTVCPCTLVKTTGGCF